MKVCAWPNSAYHAIDTSRVRTTICGIGLKPIQRKHEEYIEFEAKKTTELKDGKICSRCFD